MRRFLALVVLVAPLLILILFFLRPDLDRSISLPIFHFYVVTFTSFSAAVIAILLTTALVPVTRPRYVLAAAAFAFIGAIFLTHGLATTGVIIQHYHPAVAWSAWLTLMGGGILFALAGLDGEPETPTWLQVRPIVFVVAILTIVYLSIAALVPDLLNQISGELAPWHQFVLFILTLALWLFAGYRLGRSWLVTRARVDGVLCFVAFWLAQATVSMHQFPLSHLSWWLYHAVLLISFLVTAYVLLSEFEQARQFRLLPYYLAISVILTAFLALVASQLFANFARQLVIDEIKMEAVTLIDGLAGGVVRELPATASPTEVREQFAATTSLASNFSVRIFDLDGEMREAYETYRVNDGEWPVFQQALTGDTTVVVYEPGMLLHDSADEAYEHESYEHEPAAEASYGDYAYADDDHDSYGPAVAGDDSNAGYVVRAYVPLWMGPDGSNQLAGIAQLTREVPGLTDIVIRARAASLALGAFIMALLFTALMLVIRRADQIITARSRDLALANQELRRSESIRQDLMHMIIHDLRNPLTVIGASFDLIRRTADQATEVQLRLVERGRKASARMNSLIDDILAVGKIEAGELVPNLQTTSMVRLLQERAEEFAAQATAQGKRIELECPAELPVLMDEHLIGRVVDNLVSNAFKYTDDDSGIITLAARRNNGRVEVRVCDNGVGVPDGYKELIFEKFAQIVTPSTEAVVRKGTGLGLAFCQLVVRAHGGHIWVQDGANGGSEFVFWLPAAESQVL